MNTQRIFAILAAVMIVVSVGLATLGPRPEDLGPLLAQIDPGLPLALKVRVIDWFGEWSWSNLVLPILVRPGWLLPLCVSIVSIGAFLSVSGPNTPRRSRRRS